MIVCYALAPFIGAVIRRNKWYKFRKRFNELRLCPFLNYGNYWMTASDTSDGVFCFSGNFESVTDGQTLWIRSEDLTVPVSLKNTESYLLSSGKNESLPEDQDPEETPPEKIRWEKVSTLTEGVKVFVGGQLKDLNGCRSFVSSKENPLIVIFYYCPDDSLVPRVIQSGRQWNDYWNSVTPYSLVIGAIGLILTAVLYRSRPAYRLTVIFSVIALFIPLYPIIPPGLMFTGIYRRLSWKSRELRVRGDLVRLDLVDNIQQTSARSYTIKAYLLETTAWVFLPAGIALNILFLRMILSLFGILF